MKDLMIFIDKTECNKVEKCKGVFARYIENSFSYGNRTVFTKELRVLKRKSCKGCSQCYGIYETLQEQTGLDMIEFPDIPKDTQNGDILLLKYGNISTCYETGVADDWEIIGVKSK